MLIKHVGTPFSLYCQPYTCCFVSYQIGHFRVAFHLCLKTSARLDYQPPFGKTARSLPLLVRNVYQTRSREGGENWAWTSLGGRFSRRNQFYLHVQCLVNQTHFRIKGYARRLQGNSEFAYSEIFYFAYHISVTFCFVVFHRDTRSWRAFLITRRCCTAWWLLVDLLCAWSLALFLKSINNLKSCHSLQR